MYAIVSSWFAPRCLPDAIAVAAAPAQQAAVYPLPELAIRWDLLLLQCGSKGNASPWRTGLVLCQLIGGAFCQAQTTLDTTTGFLAQLIAQCKALAGIIKKRNQLAGLQELMPGNILCPILSIMCFFALTNAPKVSAVLCMGRRMPGII